MITKPSMHRSLERLYPMTRQSADDPRVDNDAIVAVSTSPGCSLPRSSPHLRQQRLAERLKQGPVDRIALRIVFGMPLHAEREGGRFRDPDRLDGAVLRHALDHHPFARLEDSLTMQ